MLSIKQKWHPQNNLETSETLSKKEGYTRLIIFRKFSILPSSNYFSICMFVPYPFIWASPSIRDLRALEKTTTANKHICLFWYKQTVLSAFFFFYSQMAVHLELIKNIKFREEKKIRIRGFSLGTWFIGFHELDSYLFCFLWFLGCCKVRMQVK